MGKSKDLATGETRFVNTSGDSMTGALSVSGGANSAHLTLSGSANRGLKISTSNPDGQNDGTVILNAQDTESSGIYAKMAFQTAGTERMKIDNAGRVTKPNQPCFIAYTNTTFDTTTATNTIIRNLNGIHLNVGSHYITSGGTASRFVAPITGRYFFGFQLLISNVANGDDDIHASFWKNGSSNIYANTRYHGEAANGNFGYGGYLPIIGNTLIQLAANDYIELNLFASGGPIGVHNSEVWSRFYGYLLG